MALDFISPSYRAAGSDLTIAVSPLGLIELSDEEFEINGPRLTRYANEAAFYLGHHWAYQRPPGEPQLTANYVAAFSDFLTNFTFSKSVQFGVDPEFTHITPALLDRIWDQDNRKDELLWMMGNLGSVYGDCFVKIAYEPAYENVTTGQLMPGRVRILPINPSFAFPEWHPHDKDRMIRFKLKYRFWSCVDTETEALTGRGWKKYFDLLPDDVILTRDPVTDAITWKRFTVAIHESYPGHLVHWPEVGAVTTPNHRWLVERQHGRMETSAYTREIARTEFPVDGDRAVPRLTKDSRVLIGGGVPLGFSNSAKWDDELIETVGWYVTEGCDHYNQTGFHTIKIAQSQRVYPRKTNELRRLAAYWRSLGATFNEGRPNKAGVVEFYLGKGVNRVLEDVAPGKQITPEFLCSLTYQQARLLRDVLLDADGYLPSRGGAKFTQIDPGRRNAYQMLDAMLGIRTGAHGSEKIYEFTRNHVNAGTIKKSQLRVYPDDNTVWCPEIDGGSGIWMARRDGNTFWTGNTAPEGTRMVNTYCEIITEQYIEEYINDELIDRRVNPLGIIPIVHIANKPVAASPWGLSDIVDILPLNRTFNEVATDILDIINYYTAPVTIITGAKPDNLLRGANKIWAIPNKDANVQNLAGGFDGLPSALEFLDRLKLWMHELTGVPQTALGQEQEISNTSGVALALQFFPTMLKYNLKKTQYGNGLRKISQIALMTKFTFEPETLVYNPETDGIIRDGQPTQIDPYDPQVYDIDPLFPPPLPQDALVLLNEIQAKMVLDLESKQGALKQLGEQFPDEKLQELWTEQIDDLKMAAAKRIVNAQIDAAIIALTGIVPQDAGEPVQGAQNTETKTRKPDGTTTTQTKQTTPGIQGPSALPALPGIGDLGRVTQDMGLQTIKDLVVQAAGTKLPQRRIVDKNPSN